MAREIGEASQYADKLVKLIPTEIIGAYLAIDGMTATIHDERKAVLSITIIGLLIIIPFYLWFMFKIRNKLQIIITMISFVVWVFSMGGPFLAYEWYLHVYGSVTLVLWTLVVPLFSYSNTE